ncbi:MAG TPA: hypothetical protein PLN63_10145 [Paludibacteraceae bacterium]|nr:hypothetical protein [Paludibacteraceae bacterium]HOU69583.1 hypothetical protein [Paludibacteraceae bacterium]HPH63958.1 hypothetical protein [Paludibacteraceae bacterium]HQF51248.1 hypothetical protein [Paludibacteraceae bacterium]
MKHSAIILCLILLSTGYVSAQTSPRYFGALAYPVPDLPDSIHKFWGELKYNYTLGDAKDYAMAAIIEANIPLFSDRVSISCWFPIQEYWFYTRKRVKECGMRNIKEYYKGHDYGDAIIHTNIKVFTEKKIRPEFIIRCALKTASTANGFNVHRFYDDGGCFFDGTFNKSYKNFTFSLTSGFLCWNTCIDQQNDATMYGLRIAYKNPYFVLTTHYGGYAGWQGHGDCPMVIREHLLLHTPKSKFSLGLHFTRGLNDYPYSIFECGIRFDW